LYELSLAEVLLLRLKLPRRDMGSPVALLRACYERLHGVHGEALRSFAKPHQKAWSNFKRSVDAVLDGKSASAAAQRQPRPVRTHNVCVLGCRLFVPLFPNAGALLDMSLPFDDRVAAFEQFTNGTREPSRARARRQAHARRPA
jgi:hypothetical protein